MILLDFEDEITACIEVNWFTPHKVRTLVATGSKGIAYLDYIEQSLTIQNSAGMKVEKINKAEPLKLEIVDFLNSITGKNKPAVDGKDGLNTLKIALVANQGHFNKLSDIQIKD